MTTTVKGKRTIVGECVCVRWPGNKGERGESWRVRGVFSRVWCLVVV